VFLHGWGLGYRSYKRGLKRLVELGLRVYAPALPGFAGTPDLPPDDRSMQGYARWTTDFLDAVGVDEPLTLVGHSFGGGVAIVTAHRLRDRVARLVLVNSIGGSVWTSNGSRERPMSERPLWDWGLHFQADAMPLRQLRRVVPVILEDALPNLLRNAGSVIRVAGLARRADLTRELEDLRNWRVPVVILWGENDKVLPELSFRSLRDALGGECITVPGNHGWLLADPAAFGEVMTNIVGVAEMVDRTPPRRAVGG
jgi:pimeloyl-ACP methyl ester carboxylesterase